MYFHPKKQYYILCLVEANQLHHVVWKSSQPLWQDASPLEVEESGFLEWAEKTFQKKDAILEKVRDEHKDATKTTPKESLIGFIGSNKASSEIDGYSFKLKNMLQVRNALGASCDQGSREITINRLAIIRAHYGKEKETYQQMGDNIFVKMDDNEELRISKHHICFIYEIFLRMVPTEIWFLNPEESVYTDIVHLTVQTNAVGNQYKFDLITPKKAKKGKKGKN